MNQTKVGVGARPATVYVGRAGRWSNFKAKRWLGIPAPVVAAFLALVLAGGAALAAVIFLNRATVSGNVSADPETYWGGVAVANADGASVNASFTDPGPAVASSSSASTSVQFGKTLTINIADSYRGASFDVNATAYLPCSGGSNVGTYTCASMMPPLMVTGYDFDGEGVYTVTLTQVHTTTSASGVTLPVTLNSPSGNVVATNGGGMKWAGFAVSVHFSIDANATLGPIPTQNVAGLKFELAS